MKRWLMLLLSAGLSVGAFAQDAIAAKIDGMGVKAYSVKEAPSKEIKKLYVFNEAKIKGGVAVYKSSELRVDIYIVIVQKGSSWEISSVGMVDTRKEAGVRGGQIKAAYDKLKGTKDTMVLDAISSATRHCKGILREVEYIFGKAVAMLKTGS